MAMTALPITSDQASLAMLDGLTERVRSELKKRIMERIEPDVDAAVDAALAAFKATIETYRDPTYMRDTVRVLVERKGSPLASAQREGQS